ncbi:hypothetical protein ACMU9U_000861 [Yersinia enterocolitica]
MVFVICLLIFIGAFWVMKDAYNNQLDSPVKWGIGVAFIWIIFLPLYLIRRKKLIANQQMVNNASSSLNEPRQTNLWPGIIITLLVAFIPYGLSIINGELPKCDATEVNDVLTDLLPGVDFSNPAQYDYEKMSEIRHCNLTIDNRIHSFTVKWYSDAKEQFVVKFD